MSIFDSFVDRIGNDDPQAKTFIKDTLAEYEALQGEHREALQELEKTKEFLSETQCMAERIKKQLELLQRTLDLLLRSQKLVSDPIEKEVTNGNGT